MAFLLSPYHFFLVFLFVFGSCLGSFLNLVIYRLPLHMSIVKPRSFCPDCQKTVPVYGLIPIVGFFLLGGACLFCKKKISWRYPLVETFCAVVTSLLFVKFFDEMAFLNFFYQKNMSFADVAPFLTALWLLYSGVVLSMIDLKYKILPDVITLPGIIVGVVLSVFNPHVGFIDSLLGVLVALVGLYGVIKIYELIRNKEGMGLGDVKYLGLIGASVGVIGVFYTLFVACVLGSVVGIGYGLYTKKGLSVAIPFGPFLAAAALGVSIFNNT